MTLIDITGDTPPREILKTPAKRIGEMAVEVAAEEDGLLPLFIGGDRGMIAIHRRGSTPTSDSPVVVAGMITRTLEGLRLELRARPGAELVITEDDARALVRTRKNAPIHKVVTVGRVQVTEEIGSMYGSPCKFWYRSPHSRGVYIHVMSGLPRLPLLFASMEDVREVYQGLRCMAVVGYPRHRAKRADIPEGDTRTVFWRDQDG